MKQKLFLLIFLFCSLKGFTQANPWEINNPNRTTHSSVACSGNLTDSSCNLVVNPRFNCTGDSLEAFSDGDVSMWQDVNNLTTDINGALATTYGWNVPAVPANLIEVNFASMLVDNLNLRNEGIAGRTFPLISGKKYALSFFLSSSELLTYRTQGGKFKFKIFLVHCQNFPTSNGNPEISDERQLIFCRSFEKLKDSDWQQYFVTFEAQDDYNMIVAYPEVESSSFDGGAFVHFLYPELIPINPTNQYMTYTGENGPEGMTLLSACGVTNASYQWVGRNGPVSDQVSDIISYDSNIGENDPYDFSMWVDGAIGNERETCEDAASPVITESSTNKSTTEHVDVCDHNFTPPFGCNGIPNPTFQFSGTGGANAFGEDRVLFWSSLNDGTPDINGAAFAPPPLLPSYVPVGTNTAGMYINDRTTGYTYEGIYAKLPHLVSGRTYAFSFFLNTRLASIDPEGGTPVPADFNFSIALSNCNEFQINHGQDGMSTPPVLGNRQDIICQHFPGIETVKWRRYLVTFVADANYDMISIYPTGNQVTAASSYIHFLMPELIDVTNLITTTINSSCNYTLQSCGVTNATYEWRDGDGNIFSSSNPVTVDATINPPLYRLKMSVPDISISPGNACSDYVDHIDGLAFGNEATWTGTTSTDWNVSTNWLPAVVPDDVLTDVIIPSVATAPNQPTIFAATQPHSPTKYNQVNSIHIESGGTLTNLGLLKVARNITKAGTGKIDNYLTTVTPNSHVITGSIEMNGTCKSQTLAGNVFETNDVKNFTASNNVTISSVTGEGLDVWGELGFDAATNTTLTTGDNLTLVSTASSTANVAQIDASNFIDGNVTVERHILTGLGGGEHAKTWQALATPTGANSIGQTVKESWMEGGVMTPPVGYGTHVPDPRIDWNIRGFDASTSGTFGTAIKTYNVSTQGFESIDNTNIPLYNKNGYFLFVRGDRYQTLFTSLANPTNLRSKGALFQPHTGYSPPNVTAPSWTSSPQKYVMVGNPYASAIDLEYMYNTTGYFSNLTSIFIVWDVSIPGTQGYGGYQYLDAAATIPFSPILPGPGGTGNYYESGHSYPEIQSGQAFFVSATNNGSTGFIHFDENAKSGNSRIVTKGIYTPERKRLWAGLYSGTGICDGTSITFDKDYSNEIGADDAGKLPNPGENFMIVKENGVRLAIEKKQPIGEHDSIFYSFSNMRMINYRLQFAPTYLQDEGLHAFVIDNYLHRRIALSLEDSSYFDFTIDANNASYENRFVVVFERNAVAPLIVNKNEKSNESSFVIYPNPTENKTINIRFINQLSGIYKLQLLNQAGQIVFSGNKRITDKNEKVSIKPGRIAAGSYQVMIIASDGRKSVQRVVIQ